MQVLLVAEYGSLNGGEQSLLALLPRMIQAGVQFSATVPADTPFSRALESRGVTIQPLPFSPIDSRQLSLGARRVRVSRVVEQVKPDLVHSNSLAMARLVGPLRTQVALPTVGHLRDIVRLSQQSIADLNHNDCLIAVSEATRRWHQEQGVDPHRFEVIYNGVDAERFMPRPSRGALHNELGIPATAPIVLSIGQLGMRKGFDLIPSIARRVIETHSDCHFVVVGERHSEKDEVIRLVERMKIEAEAGRTRGRIHFAGRREDIVELLNEADVLLHPARQEPLGRVLLEAGACDRPIVATNVGGTTEIFSQPLSRVSLVEQDDVAALAAAVIEQIHQATMGSSAADELRRHIGQKFAVDRAAEELMQVYKRCAQ